MTKPKLFKKSKDTKDFIQDITNAYSILSKKKKLYMITLEGIYTPHTRDLGFQLTNKFFNSIHKDIRHSYEYINYLFIIEYGGIISKEKEFDNYIEDLGIHAHCIVNTSITKEHLEYYINSLFKSPPNYKIQDISKSDTKENLLNYLLKQSKSGLLTSESYNYKINI